MTRAGCTTSGYTVVTCTKTTNGRPRFLIGEYGSFRPWIARFFLDEVLPRSRSLLDPMAGTAPMIPFVHKSKTVAYFVDILPVHYYMNAAKTYSAFRTYRRLEKSHPRFFLKETCRCLGGLRGKRLLCSDKWVHEDILAAFLKAWERTDSHGTAVSRLLKALIIQSLRPFSCATPSVSNHTWMKPGGTSTIQTVRDVVASSLSVLESFYSSHYDDSSSFGQGKVFLELGDACKYAPPKPVDTVFTSPPYPNRFEPKRAYGPELYFLYHAGVDFDNPSLLGTTKVRDYSSCSNDCEELRANAPKTAQFLDTVRAKSRVGENEYYFRYYVRYYTSLFRAAENSIRSLREAGCAYFVLQNNVHRGELNTPGKFLIEFFERRGRKASIVRRRPQPHHGLRNISADYPLVLRKHYEEIIEVQK